MSTFTWASHTPLFDRLGAQPPDSPSARLQQGAELRASIACDLGRLLNTRNGLTLDEARVREASVLTYGLPDTLALGTQAEGGLQVLAELVQRSLTAFEPRLREVSVQVQPDGSCPHRVRLVIRAAAAVGRQMQRVDFEILLDDEGKPQPSLA